MSAKVVLRYLDGQDKVALLNQVLDLAGLEGELENERLKLDKSRTEFKIAIKPNASMFVRRDDDGTTTDPLRCWPLWNICMPRAIQTSVS